ncbi:hypothetical protein [Solemya velesiana gill symbiont]|uniref:Uncharacterized protein n=1 Tax=Solemya velesiana gill symbiont TaxID=1918948 RepID=A0A1T2KUQ1_9GAMM|nr:hypothetical protein [Solemya velesiana gill symbiont]OOZ36552.1 hypothetical protein BOW51_06525 [Solemya velesiana gill symbiont]
MKYKITDQADRIDIDLTECEEEKEQLLEALQACREGRCSCPTQEYEKVDTLDIDVSKNEIHLEIKAKKGESIDKDEIEKCLEYTRDSVSGA